MWKSIKKNQKFKQSNNSRSMFIYEKSADGETVYDNIFSRLMKERIIFINDDIDDDNSGEIIAQMLWLDNQNSKKEINLYINSPGGDVDCMFAIYDAMHLVKSPIHTYAIGKAYSAAAVILTSGAKGGRFALPNTRIMIHQPLAYGVEGQVTDVAIQAKQFEIDKKMLVETIARHCGKTYEKVLADCERDLYFLPAEAVEYGLIDGIVSSQKEIPELLHEADTKKKTRK